MAIYRKPKYGRKPGKFVIFLRLTLVAFLLVLMLFLIFGKMDQSKHGFQKLFSVFSTASKEVKRVTHGIDVARYQGTIDWKQAADSGVEFAMVRLGYRTQVDGEIVEDSNARYNLQEASRNGVQLGAYFFSTAINPDEVLEEAAWCADILSQYPITYPVAYNCEGFLDSENRQNVLTKGQRTELARIFLEAMEDYGYEGMFYASKNEMEEDTHWIVSELEDDFKIWVAQYPDRPYPETGKSSYSRKHHMWQFTTLGNLPGIEQNVDCDLAYFGYTKPKKPLNSEPPKEAKADPVALMYFKPVDEAVTAKEETNLRSLPGQGTESQVMLTLHHGQVARRVGMSDNGWSKVEYNGETYYAVTTYLTTNIDGRGAKDDPDGIETEFQDTDEEVTAKDAVNLRSIPSVTDEKSKILGQLKKGDIARRTGVSTNGWSRLDYNGKTCYAVTRYLIGSMGKEDRSPDDEIRTQFAPVSDKVTAKDVVNLRDRPSVEKGQSEVIAQLKNGTVIERIGINKDLGWSKVLMDGKELYCISAYLKSAD